MQKDSKEANALIHLAWFLIKQKKAADSPATFTKSIVYSIQIILNAQTEN